MKSRAEAQIVTANGLLSGEVVFWDGSSWRPEVGQARVFHEQEGAEAALLEASARQDEIVGPYLVGVTPGGDEGQAPTPAHIRERLRTLGPSVRLDLGRQAETDR